ncbi:hypothetical protein BJX68DRAFT_231534 [Aspergillus pseudodeflectus]|uniref:Uncharacterized protein n=1 Tax=Aspergillus pseudodeflectus TaxID=176178 RepID=A0ABR4KS51_9EURO
MIVLRSIYHDIFLYLTTLVVLQLIQITTQMLKNTLTDSCIYSLVIIATFESFLFPPPVHDPGSKKTKYSGAAEKFGRPVSLTEDG